MLDITIPLPNKRNTKKLHFTKIIFLCNFCSPIHYTFCKFCLPSPFVFKKIIGGWKKTEITEFSILGELSWAWTAHTSSVPCLLPHMITEGSRWKHVQLVGSDLDLRKVSWKLPADIIPHCLSPATDAIDNHAQTLPQGEDLSLADIMPSTPNVNPKLCLAKLHEC